MKIELYYDVAVIGGGMAGICAAIAAARQAYSVPDTLLKDFKIQVFRGNECVLRKW